jgi:hypothetical protein
MKYLSVIIVAISGLIYSAPAFSHLGHAHGPETRRPLFGGVIHEGKTLGMELVQEGGRLRLYPLVHEKSEAWKAAPMTDVKILSASYKLPRQKDSKTVELKSETDHYVAEIHAPGAHRFDLKIGFSIKGVKDEVTILVEPKH